MLAARLARYQPASARLSITLAAACRADGEDRIAYLAKVRNAALAPLYNATFRKQVADWMVGWSSVPSNGLTKE
jgi:hypothetical protein